MRKDTSWCPGGESNRRSSWLSFLFNYVFTIVNTLWHNSNLCCIRQAIYLTSLRLLLHSHRARKIFPYSVTQQVVQISADQNSPGLPVPSPTVLFACPRNTLHLPSLPQNASQDQRVQLTGLQSLHWYAKALRQAPIFSRCCRCALQYVCDTLGQRKYLVTAQLGNLDCAVKHSVTGKLREKFLNKQKYYLNICHSQTNRENFFHKFHS